MRYLSVCSGIEAASVAWHPLGWEAVGFAEIDKFPSRVLAHHYPDVPNFGDFTTIDTTKLGRVDLLVGGTPCQAFSIAGNRLSLQDARGNLSLAYTVLAHELARSNGMRFAVWENVPGVLSTQDNAFGSFLGGIVGADDPIVCPAGIERWPDAGMVSGPRARAAWRILDAQFFGLAQRRRRVFVVAGFGEGADPAQILFERKSGGRHSPPRRETRKDIAPTIAARTRGGGGLGTDFDCDGGLIASTGDVAHCLNAGGMGRIDYETETLVAQGPICFSAKDHGGDAQVDLSPTLRAGGFDGSHANAGVMPAIAFDARQSDVIQYGNMTGPLDTDGHTMAVAIQAGALRENPASGPDGVGVQADLAYTIEARAEVQAVAFAENSRAELREKNASTSKAHSCQTLQLLRHEIGAEAFAEWGLGILDSFQPSKILRSEVYGARLRCPPREDRSGLDDRPSARQEDGASWPMSEVRGDGRKRRASRRWQLPEQLSIELGTHLSQLSQQGASAEGFLLSLWQAGEGIGLLREALSALQKVRRSSPDEGQSAHANWAVRRLTPVECSRLMGFPDDYLDLPNAADGPKYKALGNSFAVPVVAWLGKRIAACG
jgi:site-specific DNA-cytosine methylase